MGFLPSANWVHVALHWLIALYSWEFLKITLQLLSKKGSTFGSVLGVFGGHVCDEKQAVRCASRLTCQTQLGFAVTMLAKIL